MTQHTDIALDQQSYSRVDFTALRAWLNRIPIHQIASHYYPEDLRESIGCEDEFSLKQRLDGLKERLILQTELQNPHLSELLRTARRTGIWSTKLINFLVQQAENKKDSPRLKDPISAWFKQPIVRSLQDEDVFMLGDLVGLINVRGIGWWKPIKRIGKGKAKAIQSWLERHQEALGATLGDINKTVVGSLVGVVCDGTGLAPLERIDIAPDLDGRNGINRNTGFCLISARHDREAIEAYLYRYEGQDKTCRAYKKELERFLLWCIGLRGKPMSSILHDDCEQYKNFLTSIPESWIGVKRKRHQADWRPFATQLSSTSQRYAIQALRQFFDWLVDVRYLLGNPWKTVNDPIVARKINTLDIDKALSIELWNKLTDIDGILDQMANRSDDEFREEYRLRGSASSLSIPAQFRLVRAVLLLIGDTGIRREEAAFATRNKLRPVRQDSAIWELDILGKRHKWRTVFPSTRAVSAIQSHWNDRHQDFSFGISSLPLFSPLVVMGTQTSQEKHINSRGEMNETGFSPDGLYQVVKTALTRIANDSSADLSDVERHHLLKAAPHAFRHTFGTHAVASDVPLDVVQRVLGHASLQTTTIYVQAEKQRNIQELGKFFKRNHK